MVSCISLAYDAKPINATRAPKILLTIIKMYIYFSLRLLKLKQHYIRGIIYSAIHNVELEKQYDIYYLNVTPQSAAIYAVAGCGKVERSGTARRTPRKLSV
jgi:hypothetical protein